MEGLTEEERKALRGSKFAPLPSSSSRPIPRLAHPGGPVTTNKAAALAKFLERKLQEPDGLASLNPEILELAVRNAKATVNASGSTQHGRIVRHVDSFADVDVVKKSIINVFHDDEDERIVSKKLKKEKKKMKKMRKKKDKGKSKKLKSFSDPNDPVLKKRRKIEL